jgi:hypothetical protein
VPPGGGGNLFDGVAHAEDDLREAGAGEEMLQAGTNGRDLNGLVEERGLNAMVAGQE